MENFNNFFNNYEKNEITNEELVRLANENTFSILMGKITIEELFEQDIDIPLLYKVSVMVRQSSKLVALLFAPMIARSSLDVGTVHPG